ncbi:hypothetical protein [Haematobacter sp.]|uniref:hypothetical protein n=1 Tax=Haematobacter sp. TaxID=2953762 RepID=UPI0028AA34DB|nr:hypothetical protein [Haematobacter sp.]
MTRLVPYLVACALALSANLTQAQQLDQNEANNPLTPKITLNLHDYYVPRFYDLDDRWANQLLFRGVIPFEAFGRGQLFRFTLPIATAPNFTSGHKTGLGDLTIMNIVPFASGKVDYGVGALLVLPTASDDLLGAGKWQAGLAGLVIAPETWGILGGLVTWQTSFAGDGDREDVHLLTVQPIANYNLPNGWYLRSGATWNFDLQNGDYAIPVGFGAGRVIPISRTTTINLFIEPQYTLWHEGPAQPKWQVFAGINIQLSR